MSIMLVVLALILGSGCGGGEQYARRYVLTQQAAMIAPGGTAAVGSIMEKGKTSAQGGIKVVHTVQGESNTARAQLGHLLMNRTIEGRVVHGLAEGEIGVFGSYGNTRWASATSDIEPTSDPHLVTHAFWGGLQARGMLFGDRLNGVALLAEVAAGRVPFKRHVETTTTWYDYPYGPPSRVEVDEKESNAAELHVLLRSGVQGFLSLDEGLTFNLGVMAQSQPRFWARRVAGETCNDNIFDDQPASCQGDSPESLEPYNTIYFGTLFAGGSMVINETVSVHAQVFYHAFAQDVIRDASPVGGDLQLRITF